MHKIVGGYLVQQRDLLGIDEAELESRLQPQADATRKWPT